MLGRVCLNLLMEKTPMASSSDALRIVERMIGKDARLQNLINEARLNASIARMIYGARSLARQSQHELASAVKVSESVIARLEDADYNGDILNMLVRIAAALDKRIDIRLLPAKKPARPA
jgi:ribosome-binding protein aMBF1 (putative translation factor)